MLPKYHQEGTKNVIMLYPHLPLERLKLMLLLCDSLSMGVPQHLNIQVRTGRSPKQRGDTTMIWQWESRSLLARCWNQDPVCHRGQHCLAPQTAQTFLDGIRKKSVNDPPWSSNPLNQITAITTSVSSCWSSISKLSLRENLSFSSRNFRTSLLRFYSVFQLTAHLRATLLCFSSSRTNGLTASFLPGCHLLPVHLASEQ